MVEEALRACVNGSLIEPQMFLSNYNE